MNSFMSDGIRAVNVSIMGVTGNQYAIAVAALNTAPISQTDVLLLQMDIRADVIAPASQSWMVVETSFQTNGPPYSGNLGAPLNLTSAWQTFQLPFVSKYDAEVAAFRWQVVLGFAAPAVVQVRNGSIIAWPGSAGVVPTALPVCCNYGYDGRDPDASWRNASLASARSVRRANVTVSVLSAVSGKPVSDALVVLNQTKHAFRHGSAVDGDIIAPFANQSVLSPNDTAAYMGVLNSGLFQTAVFEGETKWPGWIDPKIQTQALATVAWLKAHGFFIRLHNLVWPSCPTQHLPAFLCEMLTNGSSPAAVEEAIGAHIWDEAGRAVFQNGTIDDIDVVNEPYGNHQLQDFFGTNKSIVSWLNATKRANPEARLRINDGNTCSGVPGLDDHFDYESSLYASLIADGAPLEGIGCESHVSWEGASIPRYLERMDKLASLAPGLTVRITEYDMKNPDLQLGSDQLRDLLIVCFGHPACDGLLTWGFWSGRSFIGNGVFFDFDWSPKPALFSYRQLLFEEWWTHGVDSLTDARGEAVVEVWQGWHNVTVTAPGGVSFKTAVFVEQFENSASVTVRV